MHTFYWHRNRSENMNGYWHLLFMLCLLAGVVVEVFHRRASTTENVSVSNTNGLPLKILSPWVFCYFYILIFPQLQSLCIFRYVLILFDFCKKTNKSEHKLLLKIPHYFVNWLLVETMVRPTNFFHGWVLSFWTYWMISFNF